MLSWVGVHGRMVRVRHLPKNFRVSIYIYTDIFADIFCMYISDIVSSHIESFLSRKLDDIFPLLYHLQQQQQQQQQKRLKFAIV